MSSTHIDIDRLFKTELLRLLKDEIKTAEEIEEKYAEIYIQWANSPNSALEGLTPNEYYSRMDSRALIQELNECVCAGRTPSDALLDAITDNSACPALLLDILRGAFGAFDNADQLMALRRHAITLLNQCDHVIAKKDYIRLIVSGDPLSAEAAFGLETIIDTALDDVLDAVPGADDKAREYLLSAAAASGGDRVRQMLIEQFKNTSEDRGFIARLIARCGDDSALPVLKSYAFMCDDYYSYRAVEEAVEALGGEIEDGPDFSGDPDFEALTKSRQDNGK